MTLPSTKTLAGLTVLVLAASFAMIFFFAPLDADQGFIQKIFYVHVPLAICALGGFVLAAIHSIRHLRTGDAIHDVRSYVSIHLSIIFAVATLITGAIWARASWGTWWVWQEPTLVSFLIVFLLYCTYYPLRYAIEDRERQARYASVFAITAGAFVPLNFMAVRMAQSLVHPRVFATSQGGLPADIAIAFLVSIVGMGLLWWPLFRFEMTAKSTKSQVSRLRRALDAEAPVANTSRIAPSMPREAAQQG
ncbi:cytochrome c biogenesis protein [soil metagenome]